MIAYKKYLFTLALAITATINSDAQVTSLSRQKHDHTISSLHKDNDKSIKSIPPLKAQQAPADTLVKQNFTTRTDSIPGGMKEIRIGNRTLKIPSVIDSEGTDLWMLTNDGMEFYLTISGSVFTVGPLQDYDVAKWTRHYVLRRKKQTQVLLEKYDKLKPLIQNIFTKQGIPVELGIICIIESACNSEAVSPANAVGLWQFMEDTARDYGLVVNAITDERTNPIKATEAAAKHLKILFEQTKDWNLTVAAYNCGEGRLQSCINKVSNNRDWQSIKKVLPAETAQYLPSIIAMYYIDKYRNQLGFGKTD